jgi:hypothetical protein
MDAPLCFPPGPPGIEFTQLLKITLELKAEQEKKTKTISLSSTLGEASFSLIKHGFWFAAPNELLFYPMPSHNELENKYYDWWRFVR